MVMTVSDAEASRDRVAATFAPAVGRRPVFSPVAVPPAPFGPGAGPPRGAPAPLSAGALFPALNFSPPSPFWLPPRGEKARPAPPRRGEGRGNAVAARFRIGNR